MRVIIAEKPSVAKDIAEALGRPEIKDGYYRVGNDCITWAVGHLYEIDWPEEKWSLGELPLLPEKFAYRVSDGKNERVRAIKALLDQADETVNACDAGREGELIFRLIVEQAGYTGRVSRLWTSEALSPDVVRREMERRRPGEEFESLYQAALARQQADWIAGINLTRLLTLRAEGRAVWSAGRVQTPVLRLLVDRALEICNFQSSPYWQIRVSFQKDGKPFVGWIIAAENNKKFLQKDQVERVEQDVKAATEGIVTSAVTERKQQAPPLLHSLTSLQRESNERLGLTASKTLALAQELYEAKLVSYPRTEANHLDETPQTREMVGRLLGELGHEELKDQVDQVGKRVFDTSKLTDHYAMIPQRKYTPGEKLTEEHKKVYDLLARRFIGAFMLPYVYDQTTADLDVNGHVARATGKTELQEGWKALYRKDVQEEEAADEAEQDQVLPPLQPTDRAEKTGQDVLAKKTTPPKKYTESTLLAIMERLGLGTPATRAAIIERLKKVAYIAAEKKTISPTPKGLELIGKVGGRPIADPETTARWEADLEEIYRKKRSAAGYREFMEKIRRHIAEEVAQLKTMTLEQKPEEVGKCQCGGSIAEMPKTYICIACRNYVWKESYGKKITKAQAANLLAGKKIEMKKLRSKAGREFDARMYYDFVEKRVKLEFPN